MALLDSKVAIVTGAGRGIGRAITLEYARAKGRASWSHLERSRQWIRS